jgi:hypothetical protein
MPMLLVQHRHHILQCHGLPLFGVEIELRDQLLERRPAEHLYLQRLQAAVGPECDRRTYERIGHPLRIHRDQHVGLIQVRQRRRIHQRPEQGDSRRDGHQPHPSFEGLQNVWGRSSFLGMVTPVLEATIERQPDCHTGLIECWSARAIVPGNVKVSSNSCR